MLLLLWRATYQVGGVDCGGVVSAVVAAAAAAAAAVDELLNEPLC